MFFLKCIVVGIAWTAIDWLFGFCERKLPATAWEIIRWILVPVAAVVCMLAATWLFDGGVLWPFFAWPGLVLGAAFMAPRKPHFVGIAFLLLACFMAWAHGAEAWEHSKTRRWMADIAGIGVAVAGIVWLRNYDAEQATSNVSKPNDRNAS